MNLFQIKRSIKFFWQRMTRGWDDSELWSLDVTIAEFILPRLKRFRTYTIAHPDGLTAEEWDNVLQKMIASFEFMVSDEYYNYANQPEYLDEGLQLFAQYYRHLWD